MALGPQEERDDFKWAYFASLEVGNMGKFCAILAIKLTMNIAIKTWIWIMVHNIYVKCWGVALEG